MGINGLVQSVVALVFIEAVILSFDAMIYIFAMGVMQALSFSLITSAGRYIPATEVGMFMPLGAVFGIVAGWLIISEEPSSSALIGGFIVLLTLFIHSWYSNNLDKG